MLLGKSAGPSPSSGPPCRLLREHEKRKPTLSHPPNFLQHCQQHAVDSHSISPRRVVCFLPVSGYFQSREHGATRTLPWSSLNDRLSMHARHDLWGSCVFSTSIGVRTYCQKSRKCCGGQLWPRFFIGSAHDRNITGVAHSSLPVGCRRWIVRRGWSKRVLLAQDR